VKSLHSRKKEDTELICSLFTLHPLFDFFTLGFTSAVCIIQIDMTDYFDRPITGTSSLIADVLPCFMLELFTVFYNERCEGYNYTATASSGRKGK